MYANDAHIGRRFGSAKASRREHRAASCFWRNRLSPGAKKRTRMLVANERLHAQAVMNAVFLDRLATGGVPT